MTFTEKVAQMFRAYPNRWIDSEVLMGIGGRMAWRTRVSECRRSGMWIANRVRRKANGVKVSEYRYTPKLPWPATTDQGAQSAAAVENDTPAAAPIESL